jgi:hypothetical protein
MRQITIDSIRAFRNNQTFKRGNMEVRVFENPTMGTQNFRQLRLFGNVIATLSNEGMTISTCGHNTVTTRERLNGLPNVHLIQRNFELFLNGEPWNGQAIKI